MVQVEHAWGVNPHPILSRRRYDGFGTFPAVAIKITHR
jgi:hypothetical protein